VLLPCGAVRRCNRHTFEDTFFIFFARQFRERVGHTRGLWIVSFVRPCLYTQVLSGLVGVNSSEWLWRQPGERGHTALFNIGHKMEI